MTNESYAGLAKELRRAGAAETGELQPKLFRALDLAGGFAPRPAGKRTPPSEALGIALATEYRALLARDPGTRRGDDPEDLHQLRVATRRLRAFLRAASPLVPSDWAASLRAELGWLGGHLGPARDLDVMLGRLRTEVEALGSDAASCLGSAGGTREGAGRLRYRDVGETLDGDRYFALLDRLEAATVPPLTGDETSLAKIFQREAKRMRKAFSALGESPEDDALHASRMTVKRARYAADLAAHELGRRGRPFGAAAKQMQDILGDHQDAVVAQERIRAWAATAPEHEFVAGRLVQLEQDRMAAARAAWPDAWQRLDRAARRAVR